MVEPLMTMRIKGVKVYFISNKEYETFLQEMAVKYSKKSHKNSNEIPKNLINTNAKILG